MTSVIPRFEDHFPKMPRGHGRGLGKRHRLESGGHTTTHLDCVGPAPHDHDARDQNIKDWQEERGIVVPKKKKFAAVTRLANKHKLAVAA